MKHLIAAAIAALVIVTGIVMYRLDFHFGNFNEVTKTLYALFLGVICTLIIITSFAMIYEKNTEPEEGIETAEKEEDVEEMNEIYRNREKFPLGCMGFVVVFVFVIAYTLYINITCCSYEQLHLFGNSEQPLNYRCNCL